MKTITQLLDEYGLMLRAYGDTREPYQEKDIENWFKEHLTSNPEYGQEEENVLSNFLEWEKSKRKIFLKEASHFKKAFNIEEQSKQIPDFFWEGVYLDLDFSEIDPEFYVVMAGWKDTMVNATEKHIQEQPEQYGLTKKELKLRKTFNTKENYLKQLAEETYRKFDQILDGDGWEFERQQFLKQLLNCTRQLIDKVDQI